MATRIKVRNSKALLYILKSKSIWLCFTTVCHDVLSARLSVSALHNLQRLWLLNTWHTCFGKQPLRISEGESHVPVGCNDGIYPPGLVNVSLICHRSFPTFFSPGGIATLERVVRATGRFSHSHSFSHTILSFRSSLLTFFFSITKSVPNTHKEPDGWGPPHSLILLAVRWRVQPHLHRAARKRWDRKWALLGVWPLRSLTLSWGPASAAVAPSEW